MTLPKEKVDLFRSKVAGMRQYIVELVNSSPDCPLSESILILVEGSEEDPDDSMSMMYATSKRLIWDLEDQAELNPEDDTTKTLLEMVKRFSEVKSEGLLRVLYISDQASLSGRISISENPLC